MEKKIKLSFINKGQAFELPDMTVERQEKLMEDCVELEEKYDINSTKYNREFNKLLVLYTLKEIDKNVTLENINKMHPDDYVYIYRKIWDKGREINSDEKDFQ